MLTAGLSAGAYAQDYVLERNFEEAPDLIEIPLNEQKTLDMAENLPSNFVLEEDDTLSIQGVYTLGSSSIINNGGKVSLAGNGILVLDSSSQIADLGNVDVASADSLDYDGLLFITGSGQTLSSEIFGTDKLHSSSQTGFLYFQHDVTFTDKTYDLNWLEVTANDIRISQDEVSFTHGTLTARNSFSANGTVVLNDNTNNRDPGVFFENWVDSEEVSHDVSGNFIVHGSAFMNFNGTWDASASDIVISDSLFSEADLDNNQFANLTIGDSPLTYFEEAHVADVIVGSVSSDGAIHVANGALEVTGSFENTGTVLISPFGEFIVNASEASKLGRIDISATDEAQGQIELVNGVAKLDAAQFGADGIHSSTGGGELVLDQGEITGAKLDLSGIMLYADSLIFTDEETMLSHDADSPYTAGEMKIFRSLNAAGTLTIDGGTELHFDADDRSGNGTLSGNIILDGNSWAKFETGSWNGENAYLTVKNTGSVSFGDDQQDERPVTVQLGGLRIEGGTVWNVLDDTSVEVGDLKIAEGGIYTVVGSLKANDSFITYDSDSVIDNSEARVSIYETGTFELGSTIADAISFEHGTLTANSNILDAENSVGFAGGTLRIDFDEDTELNSEELAALRDYFAADWSSSEGTVNGFINIGKASISTLQIGEDGTITVGDLEDLQLSDIIYDHITNDDLFSAVVTGVGEDTVVKGSVGSIQADEGVESITVAEGGTLQLNGSKGSSNLVGTASGQTVGLNGSSVTVNLTGSGAVGNVVLVGDSALNASSQITIGDVSLDEGTFLVTGSATTGEVSVAVLEANGGTIDAVTHKIEAGSAALSSTSLTAEEIVLGSQGSVSIVSSEVSASKITLEGNAGHYLAGGTNLEASELTVGADTTVHVGEPSTADKASSNASLYASTLILNASSWLIIDPSYNEPMATVGTSQFSDATNTLTGQVAIGRNSSMTVGFASNEAAIDQMRADGLMSGNTLNQDNGSVFYVNTPITIADGAGVLLDPEGEWADGQTPAENVADSIIMKNNSALIISAKARDEAAGGPVISFAGSGTVDVASDADNAQVLLSGGWESGDTAKIFSDGTLTSENADALKVSSVNGLLEGVLDANGNLVSLELNEAGAVAALSGTSAPIRGFLISAVSGAKQDQNAAGSLFIDSIVNDTDGAAAETAARMADFGGVALSALAVDRLTDSAVAARTGVGAAVSYLVESEGIYGGLWFMPLYLHSDSDDYSADGLDYGADIDLYGAALGADVTFETGSTVGLMFSVGSGNTDGQGAASAVSNDLNFWSVALYGRQTLGNFELNTALSYSKTDSDLKATAAGQELKASTDADVVSFGIKGQYVFETSLGQIMPFIGAKWSRLGVDDYSVKGAGGTILDAAFDAANVFSMPFGISASTDLKASGWTLTPAITLRAACNFGDDELDSDVSFTGISGRAALSSEFADSFTHGVDLGFIAKRESLAFGITAGYTGSSSSNEASVNAVFTFSF